MWVNWVSKYFEVTPKITAPSSGNVGQAIQVKGTGFASNEQNIKVILGAGTTVDVVGQDNISADNNGSWRLPSLFPLSRAVTMLSWPRDCQPGLAMSLK